MFKLSWKNFKHHFQSYLPAILVLAMGVSLINMLLYLKNQIDTNFNASIAGIDAVIGAKGSDTQLVLANVYHTDNPTGNIPLNDAINFSKRGIVKKAFPLAYGDNYRGFRVLGSNIDYIHHYNGEIVKGRYFTKTLEVVIGSHVADKLNKTVGDIFHSSHGHGHSSHDHSGHVHEDSDYKVVGVLSETGTVLDNLCITPIASVWQTHGDTELENVFDQESFELAKELNKTLNYDEHDHHHEGHDHHEHHDHAHDDHDKHEKEHNHEDHAGEKHDDHDEEHHDHAHDNHDEHEKKHNHEDHTGEEYDDHDNHSHDKENNETNASPLTLGTTQAEADTSDTREITGLILTYHGTPGFFLTSQINNSKEYTAVTPSIVVNKLFSQLGVGLETLKYIGITVLVISILTLTLTLIRVFSQRKYELALLRVFGTSKGKLTGLLLLESLWITLGGFFVGFIFSTIMKLVIKGRVDNTYQYKIDAMFLNKNELIILSICIICGMISVILPLVKAYRIDISKTLASEK